jgi:hypothetical protein
MKKLVIFLIFSIFSISAFAQDESLFTENFSLIKNPGANNHGFFIMSILFHDDYLFFRQNKGNARQHQTFQIFSSLQFSGRAPLSRIATVEEGRQRLGYRYNLIYGKQENTNSEEKSESLALGYLKRLARRSNESRKTWGTIWTVGGGVFIASGAVALSSANEEGWWGGFWTGLYGVMALTSGAILAGVGISKLAIRSGAERELEDVLSISDPGHRERASREALSSLAARGRRARILWGILWSVFSVSALSGEEGGTATAAYYGGFALYNFMRKSRAERAFQSYLKEKEFQNRLEFRLGIMPHGGVKVGFVYSF